MVTGVTSPVEHMPLRGSWRCSVERTPWPCPVRRANLLTEYAGQPIPLVLLMASCYFEAVGDLGDLPAGRLHDQFLGWIWATSAHQVGPVP
jgi:hypothetical protein